MSRPRSPEPTAGHFTGLAPLAGLPTGARRAIGAALLAVFVGALDLTVIATILPRMVSDLEINTADIDRYVWIVNGYLLAYIVAIPLVGRLSDLVGRQRVFAASLVVFLVGSVWCALADGLLGLVLGRVIQGVGGGALLPVTMALVGDLLPARRRAGALGLVGAVDTLGWVLGPLWGAALVTLAPGAEPWRWVFFVNVPLGLVAVFAIRRSGRDVLLPEGTDDRTEAAPSGDWLGRLDLVGAALLTAALLALNLGLSAGGEIGAAEAGGGRALGGTRNPLADYSLVLVVAAAAVLALFVWWERRARHPLLPLGLFRRPRFGAAMGANFVVGAALIVAMVDVPVVVALLVDPGQVSTVTGAMMAPFTLLMAALALGGGAIVASRGERWVAVVGLVLVAVGYALLWVGLRGGNLLGLLPGLVLAGAGFGLVVAPIGATAIDAAPPADRGIAAALTLVFRLLGMTVGISSLTALGVNRLQGLVGNLEEIVQLPSETTAEFFARQSAILYETVIPVSLQVVRETFLIAGVIALLALVPVWLMGASAGRLGSETG
ncbi:MAG: Multidrug efflux pump P55 [uncultured Thermomicrobiales bacterium]|uniref:Multidrug efflux pump P55 n=1 Tax=uncultured Thermomicrobiales bacterium TaxID=1645740 RepID=A0A6J4VMX8_9BACT|nr:MAG: Multidrug efflux pump P55 [uncultured Thermomicrobiales bacterium]